MVDFKCKKRDLRITIVSECLRRLKSTTFLTETPHLVSTPDQLTSCLIGSHPIFGTKVIFIRFSSSCWKSGIKLEGEVICVSSTTCVACHVVIIAHR